MHARTSLWLAVTVLALAGCGEGQRADNEFDASVAHPAYVDRHPTVLFEDGHGTPHTSSGRYRPLAELLRHDGYQVRSHRGTLTARALESADVLVLANPRGSEKDGKHGSALTPDECDAVARWVSGGGSLLLVADHAPFGLYAAELSRRFGVAMSGGTTADSIHQDPTGHDETQFLFRAEDGTLGDHPILSGRGESERVRAVRTYTGQSLAPPPGATSLLRLWPTAVDYYLPTGERLVAARRTGRVVFDGPFLPRGSSQGVALEHGKGRVVVLGEAAVITAQREGKFRWGMQEPGADNRQFALNLMRWLSRL